MLRPRPGENQDSTRPDFLQKRDFANQPAAVARQAVWVVGFVDGERRKVCRATAIFPATAFSHPFPPDFAPKSAPFALAAPAPKGPDFIAHTASMKICDGRALCSE
jgi:hypothetical protein